MSNQQNYPEHPEHADHDGNDDHGTNQNDSVERLVDALFEASPPNIAALIRARVDGELTPAQEERFERLMAEHGADSSGVASQAALERALRARCGHVLGSGVRCPQDLRDRVGALIAAPQSQTNEPAHTPAASQVAAAQDPSYADRIERASSYTRERSFWAKSPLMGIAAVLLLSVAGVLVWQSVNLSGSYRAMPTLNMEQASYSERVGAFVLNEHMRCCDDQSADAKLVERDAAEAIARFAERFDRPVQMPDMAMSEGRVDFYGAGDCHVPETSVSGHMRFDAIDDNGNPIAVSIFIAPDPGIFPLEEGVTYRVNSEACDKVGARLFVWISEGVQYLLVSEASDETCATVRELMNAPTRLSQI